MSKKTDLTQMNGAMVKDKAREVAQAALSTAQDVAQAGWAATQSAVQTGLGVAQDAVEKNLKRTSKGLKKAQKSLQDTQKSRKHQMAQAARRRKRARKVFRLGILAGIVLILLYAPWPGTETRRRLVEFWQGLFPAS